MTKGSKTPSWSIHGLLLVEYTDWKFSFWNYNLADDYCLSIRKKLPTSLQTLQTLREQDTLPHFLWKNIGPGIIQKISRIANIPNRDSRKYDTIFDLIPDLVQEDSVIID